MLTSTFKSYIWAQRVASHCYICVVTKKCIIQPKKTQVIALWTTNHAYYRVIPCCAQLWIVTKCHKALIEFRCQINPGIKMFELWSSQIKIAEDPSRLIRDGVVLLQLYRVLETWILQSPSHKARIARVDYRKHQCAVICWLASHPSHFMSSRSSTSYPQPQINLWRMRAMLRFCRRIWDSTVANLQLPFQLRLQEFRCLAWPHSTLVSIHLYRPQSWLHFLQRISKKKATIQSSLKRLTLVAGWNEARFCFYCVTTLK